MSLFRFVLTCTFAVLICAGTAQAGDDVNQAAAKAAILKAYPGLFTISANTLTWNDGTTMIWDDGRQRSAVQLNESPDIEDMFHYVYPVSAGNLTLAIDFDPGRVRYKPFFKKLYGASAKAVGQHIVGVSGCRNSARLISG